MPRYSVSAAMAVLLRGGVKGWCRLERQHLARVERPDGPERVLQEPVDEDDAVFGDGDTGEANALADLVESDVGVSSRHGRTLLIENGGILPAGPRLHNGPAVGSLSARTSGRQPARATRGPGSKADRAAGSRARA